MNWLLAAAKRRIQHGAQEAWLKAWQSDRTSRPTKRLIKAPSKGALQYWRGLRKATSSVMIQVRTGRIALNRYLNLIKTRGTAYCGCDLGTQIPQHVLMECPLFYEQRQRMWRELERRGLRRTTDFWGIVGDARAAPAIASFMIQTQLLGQFHARRRCSEDAVEERRPGRRRRVEMEYSEAVAKRGEHEAGEGLTPGRLGSGMVMGTAVEVLEMMEWYSGRGRRGLTLKR
ncbi:uncharacterized protein KD926_005174 [Aspergillus affinis]|uniref:uncharacterized protein n=1 Tax=Aspergillus affinis TaxID=1070780 RepID=UPI0022FE3D33|nr:uncharacterized protein KD926_005174 [Aspergillus affinis]KAI9034875.1 hypothetical protein KD926_005174 [Aspergillus affinis]